MTHPGKHIPAHKILIPYYKKRESETNVCSMLSEIFQVSNLIFPMFSLSEDDLFGSSTQADDDGLFSKPGGLFSSSKGLFDEDDDEVSAAHIVLKTSLLSFLSCQFFKKNF